VRFWRIYDLIEQGLALLALFVLVASVLAAGIGRSFGVPLMAAPQYAQLALIWACMLGADVAARNGSHIRVGAIFDALPGAGRSVLTLISLGLVFSFLGFIAWHGIDLAQGNWRRELGASGLSYGLVTLALPVGAILLTVSLLRRLVAVGLAGVFDGTIPLDPSTDKDTKEAVL